MHIDRRKWLICAATATAAAAAGPAARAQEATSAPWPTRPLRLVAGGAGGVTDIRARWVAQRLAVALGQAVVVENVAAAGGNLAAADVARSAPDGHTVLFMHQGIAAFNPHLYARPGYDMLTDLRAVTRFGNGSLLLAVPASLPVRSVAELLALARDKPGSLNYGSPGSGTPPHLASALLCQLAGIEAAHIPYKGGGAMMMAMLGGQLSWTIEGLTAQLPQVRSGALRALAVTGRRRTPTLPDVPTLAEAGVAGYEFEGWTGFAVPAATPAPIVARLHAEIARIAASPEAVEWFAASGAEAGVLTPPAMAEYVRAEHARWGQFIRQVGLKAD